MHDNRNSNYENNVKLVSTVKKLRNRSFFIKQVNKPVGLGNVDADKVKHALIRGKHAETVARVGTDSVYIVLPQVSHSLHHQLIPYNVSLS